MKCRVLEVSRGIAGDFCGRMLADAGAVVTKASLPGGDGLERPSPYRDLWPGLYDYLNDGKRRGIELTHVGAASIVAARLGDCDVLVVDTDGDWRLARELADLQEANPSLVVTVITPFGLTGPYQRYQGTALTASAASTRMWCTGQPDREPLQTPLETPLFTAGLIAAVGTTTMLLAKASGGRGMVVDISVQEAFAEPGAFVGTDFSYKGVLKPRIGNKFPQGNYLCADGYVGICLLKEDQWPLLGVLLGRDDIVQDPRFATREERELHVPELMEIIAGCTSTKTVGEIVELGQALRIPVVPVSNARDLLSNPQLEYCHSFRQVRAADGGEILAPSPPYRFSDFADDEPGMRSWPDGWGAGGAVSPASAVPFQPFAGLRVLDLTHYFAGPTVSYFLALLGAEVIKVESCKHPDGWRFLGATPGPAFWEKQSSYNSVNVNKFGVSVDVSHPKGRLVLERLVQRSDVLLENFTPRVMKNLGFGDEVLKSLNSRLIHLSMPAFGSEGPWRDFLGWAPSFEQAAGVTYATGYEDGEPLLVGQGWGIGDAISGYWGVFALLKALLEKTEGGIWPRRVDLSQVEAMLSTCPIPVVSFTRAGIMEERRGNGHPRWSPHGVFRCKGEDDWIAIAVRSEDEWRSLACMIGMVPERFPDLLVRRERQAEIAKAIQGWTSSLRAEDAFEKLQAVGVPAAPAFNARDLIQSEHLWTRGYFTELERAYVGRHPYRLLPIRFGSSRGEARFPAPTLGEHSRYVIVDVLGFPPEFYASLDQGGVVGTVPLGYS